MKAHAKRRGKARGRVQRYADGATSTHAKRRGKEYAEKRGKNGYTICTKVQDSRIQEETKMSDTLSSIKAEAEKKIETAGDQESLEEIRVSILGKKGALTQILKSMKTKILMSINLM